MRCACSARHQAEDESHHRERVVSFEVAAFECAKVVMTYLVVTKPVMVGMVSISTFRCLLMLGVKRLQDQRRRAAGLGLDQDPVK